MSIHKDCRPDRDATPSGLAGCAEPTFLTNLGYDDEMIMDLVRSE
jgi:hypothetical protein